MNNCFSKEVNKFIVSRLKNSIDNEFYRSPVDLDLLSYYIRLKNDLYDGDFNESLRSYLLELKEEFKDKTEFITKLNKFIFKDNINFKEGEWVLVGNDNKIPHQFKRFTGELPEWNKQLSYENIEMLDFTRFNIPNFDRSIVRKWTPKVNEWCWNLITNTLVEVKAIEGSMHVLINGKFGAEPIHIGHLEPFTNRLPTFAKEKLKKD